MLNPMKYVPCTTSYIYLYVNTLLLYSGISSQPPRVIFSDVNECQNGESKCSVNANCKNTIGSYNCKCKSGYNGNGRTCKG